ncbi:methyl-CpG-binding domain-containing protein 4-like [Lycium barbarum]|uniref:methyl-CpG-binding domain-containing protein 4-like n=1 Tax=Lycium barbarum TaxID=112863 RepID=UPI00293E04CA|nr:methyl-CpG-binding domain-containing protein 4-like [Lycium barbarum]
MAKDSPKTPKTSSRSAGNLSISIWAAQCGKCYKWRKISTQEEYEEIRSKFNEEPFHCENKPNVSCDDPTEIEYDSLRTWVIDKPNEPKTPIGFKRELCLRGDYSEMDVYYITPSGKKLRSTEEVRTFLQKNPEFSDLSTEDFSFTTPHIMDDTIPFPSTK